MDRQWQRRTQESDPKGRLRQNLCSRRINISILCRRGGPWIQGEDRVRWKTVVSEGLSNTFRKAPLAVFKLLRTSTNIVTRGIAQDIVKCFCLGNIPARLRENNRQLCFVVTGIVLRKLWHIDFGRVRSVQRRARFNEENGDVRDRHIRFFGMVAIVESHTADDGDIFQSNWG